jgi:hypothetical protein
MVREDIGAAGVCSDEGGPRSVLTAVIAGTVSNGTCSWKPEHR